MFNMRYYVITIASIFIALGIGIVVGFNINSDDLYFSQQQIIVDALEEKFAKLNREKEYFTQEIDKIMLENEKNTAFIDYVYQEMTSNRLRGLNIGIMITSEDYYYQDIRGTLEKSGAKIPVEMQYTNRLFKVVEDDLHGINRDLRINILNKEELISIVNREVVYLLTFGEERELLRYFIEEGFINLIGDLHELKDNPLQYLVIAGGGITHDKRVETVDLDIIRGCLKNFIPVVGVERGDVGYSYLPHYKKMNISAVDKINTPIGRISLILELEKGKNASRSQ